MEKEKQAKLLELGKNSAGKSNAKGKSYDRKRRKEKGGLLNMYGRVVKVCDSSKNLNSISNSSFHIFSLKRPRFSLQRGNRVLSCK